MRRDQRVDGAAELPQRLMRARFILAHQSAVPDHIRMQNGGELALAGGGFQDISHQSAMRLTRRRTSRIVLDLGII